MSRDIKYQAYDPVNAKMIDWDTCILHRILPGQSGWYWREYTGLKDKNGKEGYHKDIVRRSGELYVIEWHDNLASWFLKPVCGGWHGFYGVDMSLMCEIVGNIYENTELLEGK